MTHDIRLLFTEIEVMKEFMLIEVIFGKLKSNVNVSLRNFMFIFIRS